MPSYATKRKGLSVAALLGFLGALTLQAVHHTQCNDSASLSLAGGILGLRIQPRPAGCVCSLGYSSNLFLPLALTSLLLTGNESAVRMQ